MAALQIGRSKSRRQLYLRQRLRLLLLANLDDKRKGLDGLWLGYNASLVFAPAKGKNDGYTRLFHPWYKDAEYRLDVDAEPPLKGWHAMPFSLNSTSDAPPNPPPTSTTTGQAFLRLRSTMDAACAGSRAASPVIASTGAYQPP